MKHPAIQKAWQKRNTFHAKAYICHNTKGYELCEKGNQLRGKGELCAKGNKLYAKGSKLRIEGDILYAEGNKLYAMASKIRAEGDKLYCDAVIATYGPKAIINWRTGSIEVKE